MIVRSIGCKVGVIIALRAPRGGERESEVPRDFVREQHVLDLRAGADVVDDEIAIGAAHGDVGHDADVRDAGGEIPRDEVARFVVRTALGDPQRLTFALEERRQIRDAAVIDVRVGTAQPPDLRIDGEVALHVLVHENLQVRAGVAIRANDHVRTHAALERHVAAGIGDAPISAVVMARHADLSLRAFDHARNRHRLRDERRRECKSQ